MFRSRFKWSFNRLVELTARSRCSTAVGVQNSATAVTENGFSYGVLLTYPHYRIKSMDDYLPVEMKSAEVDLSAVRWENITGDELCRVFTQISLQATSADSHLSDGKYAQMCDSIASRCSGLKDSQLKILLAALAQWPVTGSRREPNFYTIWKAIDKTLVSRYKEFKPPTIFEFANLWYHLKLVRQSDFLYQSMNRLAQQTGRLKAPEVVLLLFYQNLMRTLSKSVQMFAVQQRLDNIVHDLRIEEIGVACMGFFKTQKPIDLVSLVDSVISKLLKNADTVPEITLTCIVKALRYQLPIPLWHRLPEVMNALVPQISRLSVTASAHVPLMLTSSQSIHEPILNTVSEKLLQNLEQARLKDMEKILQALTLLNYEPQLPNCIFLAVADQLKRPEREFEFTNWPKCLVALLHYLSMKQVFIDSLIDRVLSMDFIRRTYGKTSFIIGREILMIDVAIELENPTYSGNRLPTDVRNYLSKRYSAFIPDATKKRTKHSVFALDVIQTAERLTNQRVAVKYVLPNHSRADLIVRPGPNEFLELPEELTAVDHFTGAIRSPGVGYKALLPLSRNMFLRHRTGEVNGETFVKLRQLALLGYETLIINHEQWPNEGDDTQKEEHLRKLIANS